MPQSTPVNLVHSTPSIDVHSHEADAVRERFPLADAIRNALHACDMSCKAAAYCMELDPAQWSRQLNGDGHVPMDRLLMLPDTFWRHLLARQAEYYGLRVSSNAAIDEATQRLVSSLGDVLRVLGERR